MMARGVRLLGLIIVAFVAACRSGASAEKPSLEAREQEVRKRIASAGSAGEAEPVAKWLLPDVLSEISGIALLDDGRIVAHNDERGRVFVIDPLRGVIQKWFSLEGNVRADFEAIAVSGIELYLLTSNGRIYQFREGEDRANVPFTMIDTKLGKDCEFEGLEIEPVTGAFLLSCKRIDKRSERNQLRIYRWLRQGGGEASVSMVNIPLADAIGSNDWKTLSPSDITIDPRTGNYILITGPEKALIELTPSGNVVRSFPLPGNPQQPEGVAITRDGILIVSDESVSRPADITLYSWQNLTGETGVAGTGAGEIDTVQAVPAPASSN
ncbi:MAG: SdiA-regulated domain-containing protein [Gemmatimonadaceae bacterium]